MDVTAAPADPAASSGFVPTVPQQEAPSAAPEPREIPFRFTGTGGEYFRIWIVNLLLTLATLGFYSAWAKVRRASWFARNTELLGDRFEFVANPWAILRGRVLALLVFGFYTFAFDFSLALGLAAAFVLVAIAPLLFASAMRFRLQNTRWRGIRFGFRGRKGDAYRQLLVVVAVWISGTVVGALFGETALFASLALVLLLVPWMHHRLKAYQHRRATFANLEADFRSALGRFYAIYAIALLLQIVVLVVFALVIGVVSAAVIGMTGGGGAPGVRTATAIGIASGVLGLLLFYLAFWPYFATRIQRAVWERTTLGPHAFRTTIRWWPACRIALGYGALMLVTAGLAWPFAVVAWTRYRIGAMAVVTSESLDDAVAEIDAGSSRQALGEGVADFFGLDIGW